MTDTNFSTRFKCSLNCENGMKCPFAGDALLTINNNDFLVYCLGLPVRWEKVCEKYTDDAPCVVERPKEPRKKVYPFKDAIKLYHTSEM